MRFGFSWTGLGCTYTGASRLPFSLDQFISISLLFLPFPFLLPSFLPFRWVLCLQKLQAKAEAREAIVERELRSYASLMKNTDKTETTQLKGDGSVQSCREIEEDFM
eukprot:GHVT01049357.1.p2 GENE.GHVT01049357.1~~GHVT01049357.1.p2  ORF type:complete len:107 (+),score=10.77 GHVT01049357.1:1229-1549(+)